MICATCGADNPASAKFCNECAGRLSLGCPACGTANPPGAKFCGECAAPLGLVAKARGGATTGSGPAGGASPSAAVAERRLVSVLFADLVGFTTLSQDRDPEETRELLTRYFELARDVIDRYGGTIEKFIGDAVMAVWGAPTAHEDDAERAVRAALELVDAVPTLHAGVLARAGVVTGEAAVTLTASGQGMVAGDLVNTASRLQSVAPPGAVIVGEGTQRATASAIAFEAVGEQHLKGKSTAVPAWRALRVVAEVGGRNRAAMLEAPFVGRDEDLRLLKDLFHATGRERRVRLVSITGQAGVGKSRLAWEFGKYTDGVVETVWWHRGRSPAYGEGITFWALGEMVRSRAGLAESDDAETTRHKVAETVARWISDEAERRWVESALLALLGAQDVPSGARDQLFAAWRTFFERIAATGPLALVFEDLHWADAGLLDFIDHLLQWSKGVPIFIVTLARPELLDRRPDWGAGKRNFVSIGLEPLGEPDMLRLLAGLVPGLPEPTVRAIVARADGVPLYAVETVRMLVSEGRLIEADGAYRPQGDLSSLSVPETLQALIAARLDSLEASERGLLQQAAVLGQSFSAPALSSVFGLDEVRLEPRLLALVRRELLSVVVDPRSPERGQYGFTQALIHEVAYNTLARADRRQMHLAAARYYESLGADELAGVLATHYVAAQRNASGGAEANALAAQARIALRAAADRAVALGSDEQALAFLEQALPMTADAAEAADIHERAAIAAHEALRYPTAEEHLQAAISGYHGLGHRSSGLRATALLGRVLLKMGDAERARALLQDAVEGTVDGSSDPALPQVLNVLARARLRTTDILGGLEVADRALELAERTEDVASVAEAILVKAIALNSVDRRLEVSIMLEGLVRFAETHGLSAIGLEARSVLGYAIWDDDPSEAYATVRGGLEMTTRVGDHTSWLQFVIAACAIGVSMGDWDWVTASGEEVIQQLGAADQARLLRRTARIALFRGQPVEGTLAELRAMGDSRSDVNFQLSTEWLLTEQAALGGDAVAAREHALAMIALTKGVGSDAYPLALRGALWAGDLDLARELGGAFAASDAHGRWKDADAVAIGAGIAALEGRRGDAVAGYRDAIGRFRELGMPFELARTQVDAAIMLGPDEPEGRAAADEARAVLSRLGAVAYLAQLEARLGARPTERVASV